MIGQRHVAVLAFRNPCAFLASHHRCESPAVLENDCLFAPRDSVVAFVDKFFGKRSAHFLALARLLCVDDAHGRQFHAFEAGGEIHESVFARLCFVVGLYRRCCGAEQRLGAVH